VACESTKARLRAQRLAFREPNEEHDPAEERLEREMLTQYRCASQNLMIGIRSTGIEA
jgi:hypothetical protein